MKYSISYDEVKRYVESLPTDMAIAGYCGNVNRCLIAEAIRDKYPRLRSVSVWPGISTMRMSAYTWRHHSVPVQTPDHAALVQLADDFDCIDLSAGVSKVRALKLFEPEDDLPEWSEPEPAGDEEIWLPYGDLD